MDARALLPLVRSEHYALCLAALVRSLRAQGKHRLAARFWDDLRDACKGRKGLRAIALTEDADRMLDTPENRVQALTRLAEAYAEAPDYVLWYVAQAGTLTVLRTEAEFTVMERKAAERFEALAKQAPSLEEVAAALAVARADASPRPARQSSWQALLMQIVTLSGTLALLLWWAWTFFLSGS